MSQFTMEAKELQTALKAVSHAMQKDGRPNLMGVQVVFDGQTAQFTATDGHRLVRYTTQAQGEGELFIPFQAVKDMASLPCGDGSATIEQDGDNFKAVFPQKEVKGDFRIEPILAREAIFDKGNKYASATRFTADSGKFVRIEYRNGKEVSRKLATKAQVRAMAAPVVRWDNKCGYRQQPRPKFPDVEQSIPKTFAGHAIFDTGEFAHAIKMVGIFCKNLDGGKIQPVALQFSSGMVMLQSEKSKDGDFEVDVNAAHDLTGQIGLNARYLADALKVGGSDTVTVGFNGALEPILLTWSDCHFEMVMPLRIEWGGAEIAADMLEAA